MNAETILTTELREQLRKQVSQYARVDIKQSLLMIVFDWGLIVAAIGVSHVYFHFGLYLLAILIIACRQQALLAIMHEATHQLLSNNKRLNDFLGNAFAAYPIFASIEWYCSHHHPHHQFLNTERDQTWTSKVSNPEWHFPQTKSKFIKILLKQPLVGGVDWFIMMYKGSGFYPIKNFRTRYQLYQQLPKIFYYGIAIVLLSIFHMWTIFWLYWFVPLFFILPILQRLRRISEHFGVERTHDFNGGRDLTTNWFEKFLFSPHNIGYHLAHHQFANVPQHNLPQLHSLLMQHAGYKKYSHQNDSYILPTEKSLLKDLVI